MAATTTRDRETFSDGVQHMGSAVRGLAAEGVGALRDRAHEYVEHGRDRVREFGENVESQIHAQPKKSLLIAAGVGFLLGVICARR
jgi:ElaB/YqjD/DUF883 family membrane-anchored ribosome-binding protein